MPKKQWDQLERENSKNYGWFCAYRDLGTNRTFREAAEVTGMSLRNIMYVKERYDWERRARAWDAYKDQERQKAEINEVRDAGKRHARIAMQALEVISERIQNLEPHEIKPGMIASLLDTAVRIERLALGMAGSSVEIKQTPADDAKHIVQEMLKHSNLLDLIDPSEYDALLTERPTAGRAARDS